MIYTQTSYPKYSVCICNYNMADTIELALRSVLSQLDSTYEVLVVDDGSSDTSVEILKKLSREFESLRYIGLKRDSKRKLGETRNLSIREAQGTYVILHVDADDVWEPYIKDFISIFHRLEACLKRDFLLSGQQINIGKKDFLLQRGPYRNTHRLQDRDMWVRLAAENAYIPLDHRVFRTRLSRPRRTVLFKSIKDTWYRLIYDLRGDNDKLKYILHNLTGIFVRRNNDLTLKNRVGRVFMIIPAYIASRFDEPLHVPENMREPGSFGRYRELNRGTFEEIMTRNRCATDLSFLTKEARQIFSLRN